PFLQLFRFRVDVDRGQGDTARGLDGTETAQSSVGGVLQELAGRELMTLYRGGVGGGVTLLDRGQHVGQQLVETFTHDLPVGVVGGHGPPTGEAAPSPRATTAGTDAAPTRRQAPRSAAHGAPR